MNIFFYKTDIGRIGIAEDSGSIRNVYFETDFIPNDIEVRETETTKEASRQLNAYLTGELKSFTLPLAPVGTDYMQKVWRLLCEIPYGETASYKDIAANAGNPKAARAVGLANNRNPIPIFIPCHRVIGTSGKLTGYRGGLDIKHRLLELESRK
jgi:methylated-DNA-[protein]-cysteine S-methyltransferase